MPAVRQTSFAAGEISPSLWGRHDLPLYAHGLRLCRNFMITKQGNAISRPGTTYVAETESGSRLIPFVFSADDALVLEFRDKAIRFHKGGATVTVEGSKTKPYEIPSPYTKEDLYHIRYAQMGNVLLLTCPGYVPRELVRSADNDWALRKAGFKRPTYASIKPPAPVPSIEPHLMEQKFTVSKGEQFDELEAKFDSYSKKKKPATEGRRNSGARHRAWEILGFADETEAIRDMGEASTRVPAGVDPTAWVYRYFRLAAHFTKEEKLQYPRKIWHYRATKVKRLADGSLVESAPVDITKILLHPDNAKRKPDDEATWWRLVGEGAHPNNLIIYPTKPQLLGFGFLSPGDGVRIYRGRDGVFGLVGEVRSRFVGDPLLFWDRGDEPDYHRSPPAGTDPYDTLGTTTALTFYEGRLVFGGFSKGPEQLWASAVNSFTDFDVKNLPLASNSLKLELASRRREAIQHLLGLDRLLVFTTSSIWTVEGAGGAPLSATDLPQARVQMEVGSSEIPPLLVDSSILFVPPGKSAIRDLFFDWNQRSYTGRNIAQTAEHLLRGRQIRDWAYAATPHEQVWLSTDSQEAPLLSLTYDRESGFVAWAQHKIGTEVRSVCVVPENGRDVVYLTVARRLGGTTRRFIERMDPGGPRLANLDCMHPKNLGDEHDGESPLRIPAHLNDAAELHAIVGGSAVAFKPGEVVTARGKVEAVGIRFQPEMELLDLASDSTRTKNVKQVFFEVEATKGLWVGETFERLTEWRQRTVADGFSAPGPHTGEAAVRIGSTWNKKGRAVLRQVDPFPITVYGVTREVEFGG